MPSQDGLNDSHRELKDAVASGQLSGSLQAQAQDILGRVERPVRLGVLGLPGSGKSTLLNLLLGTNLFLDGVRLPTIQLSHGAEPQAICTLGDGSTQTLAGDDMNAIAQLSPVFVEAKLPLPALTKLSMLEVVAGPSAAEQYRAVQWASKRIDIGLWCAEADFDNDQQAIWSHVPEKIQDHSFLMLTKTDTRDDLNQRLADANEVGGDYFRRVLPIGTRAAVAARKPDGTVDKEALRSSGGIALISGLLRDVEAGQQEAMDQVHVFLRQIDFTPVERVAEPEVAPSAATLEVEAETPAAERIELEQSPKLSPASAAAVEQAVEQLVAEGQVMIEAHATGALDNATVVETCVDTVSWLADYLSNSGEVDDPLMVQNRDAAADAADLIQLIQLESGDSVASDALSLMVQLKREMQMALAA